MFSIRLIKSALSCQQRKQIFKIEKNLNRIIYQKILNVLLIFKIDK